MTNSRLVVQGGVVLLWLLSTGCTQGPIVSERPKQLQLDLGKGVTIKLVLIPAGQFMMGSPETEEGRRPEEGPQHRVIISKPFYIGVTEVTKAQWRAVMDQEPWKGSIPACPGEKYPANCISWCDAVGFCALVKWKHGATSGLKPNMILRLPTEAEWEYACRAGTTTRYSYGNDPGGKMLGEYAWYEKNADTLEGLDGPQEVAQKKPNPWGLYDMHGNVGEWCSDCYVGKYDGSDFGGYRKNLDSPLRDPKGLPVSTRRVMRGGSWESETTWCRSALRSYGHPCDHGDEATGFRIVVTVGD